MWYITTHVSHVRSHIFFAACHFPVQWNISFPLPFTPRLNDCRKTKCEKNKKKISEPSISFLLLLGKLEFRVSQRWSMYKVTFDQVLSVFNPIFYFNLHFPHTLVLMLCVSFSNLISAKFRASHFAQVLLPSRVSKLNQKVRSHACNHKIIRNILAPMLNLSLIPPYVFLKAYITNRKCSCAIRSSHDNVCCCILFKSQSPFHSLFLQTDGHETY